MDGITIDGDLTAQRGSPLGATFTVDDLAATVADAGFATTLRETLRDRLVVRLRAGLVSPAAFDRLTHLVGEPIVQPNASSMPGFPAIKAFDVPARPGRDRALDEDEAQILHHDYASNPKVAAWAILHPRTGGGRLPTMNWVDTGAVYRSLPEALRHQAEKHSVTHPRLPDQVLVRVDRDIPTMSEATRLDGPTHKLVCRNEETDEPYLLLPVRRDALVQGLSPDAGRSLLEALWAAVHASPARWTAPLVPGEILIWDNLRTVHDRGPYDSAHARTAWFLNLHRHGVSAS